MHTPEDYLARAVQADKHAKRALTPELRESFLHVAERWRRLADVAGMTAPRPKMHVKMKMSFHFKDVWIRTPPNQG